MLVLWNTSQVGASALDTLAPRSALTMRESAPPPSRSYKLGLIVGGLLGSVLALAIPLGIVWFVVARSRRRAAPAGAQPLPPLPPPRS